MKEKERKGNELEILHYECPVSFLEYKIKVVCVWNIDLEILVPAVRLVVCVCARTCICVFVFVPEIVFDFMGFDDTKNSDISFYHILLCLV